MQLQSPLQALLTYSPALSSYSYQLGKLGRVRVWRHPDFYLLLLAPEPLSGTMWTQTNLLHPVCVREEREIEKVLHVRVLN